MNCIFGLFDVLGFTSFCENCDFTNAERVLKVMDDFETEIPEIVNLTKDLETNDDFTFEITPPTADDAYNGWWISVYSEKQLNVSRASDNEMKLISMTQADAARDATQSTNLASWSADDLKQARPASNSTISFISNSGELITNAEVVRVIDGVNLIWRTGPTRGGMIKLADLPEKLRVRFGYDAAKTKAFDDLAKANKARWQQEADNAYAAQAMVAQYDSSSDDVPTYTGGVNVYVHGYYRSNGTYVNGYTRSYPHGR